VTSHAASAEAVRSHSEWIGVRDPDAPPALIACVRDVFAAHDEWEQLSHADAFIEASEVLLRRVLEGGAVARASALDLLAADACVTWAFESAADDPRAIADRANRATRAIAAIAAEFSDT
jgi:hypothetical protein